MKWRGLNGSECVCKGGHLGEVGSTEFGDPLVPEGREEEGI